MSSRPKVLIVGESPTFLYIAHALIQANCNVHFFPFSESTKAVNTKSYRIFKGSFAYELIPNRFLGSLDAFINLVSENAAMAFKYDFIFINSKMLHYWQKNPELLKNGFSKKCVTFLDSTGPYIEIGQTPLVGKVVLSVLSTIDCRRVQSDVFETVNFDVIHVGLSNKIEKKDAYQLIGPKGKFGSSVHYIRNSYNLVHGPNNLEISTVDARSQFLERYWGMVISISCLYTTSVIYEEHEISRLTNNVAAKSVIRGAFDELCFMGKSLSMLNRNLDHNKYFSKLVQLEEQRTNSRKQIYQAKSYLSEFIVANKIFYDFSQGHELDSVEFLTSLSNLAKTVMVETPFLESILSIITQMIRTRDQVDEKGKTRPGILFEAKCSKNEFLRIDPIHGIPPSQNMMNYPPFYPKPRPSAPTHTSDFVKEKTDQCASEVESVDKEIRELLVGREALTYAQETFFDAQEKTSISPQVTAAQLPIPSTTPQFTAPYGSGFASAGPNPAQTSGLATHPMKNFNVAQNQYEVASTLPAYNLPPLLNDLQPMQPPMPIPQALNTSVLKDNFGNSYFYHPNGYIIPVSGRPGPSGYPPIARGRPKNLSFYHVPVPPNRTASHDKLRMSQANLLEQIQFDALLGMNHPSRYGQLDTLTQAMNHGSNSSRSSGLHGNRTK